MAQFKREPNLGLTCEPLQIEGPVSYGTGPLCVTSQMAEFLAFSAASQIAEHAAGYRNFFPPTARLSRAFEHVEPLLEHDVYRDSSRGESIEVFLDLGGNHTLIP